MTPRIHRRRRARHGLVWYACEAAVSLLVYLAGLGRRRAAPKGKGRLSAEYEHELAEYCDTKAREARKGGTMQRFTVTGEHVALLRRAYVSWNGDEFGAPTIDPKRPYGNSDVEADIFRVLEMQGRGAFDCTAEELGRMRSLHTETQTALQIFLRTGAMEPGTYEASDYGRDWHRVP
jgi:hypothetical protein